MQTENSITIERGHCEVKNLLHALNSQQARPCRLSRYVAGVETLLGV